MNEASKNHDRRISSGDYEKYFSGKGIDIGCGNDPVTPDCDRWDKPQGDAQYLKTIANGHYDWLHSSHCLEHMVNPEVALKSWWRVIKQGGYMILTVPDYFLYEKKVMPSRFNHDHKFAFSMLGQGESFGILEIFRDLPLCQVVRVTLNDTGFDYADKVSDQTMNGAQAEIEVIARKVKDSFWTSMR